MLNPIRQKIAKHPKSLFLVDAVGAILSAFLLGVVLVRFEGIFGIPPSVLYLLASFPLVFALFDFFAMRQDTSTTTIFLKRIAVLNLLYCCLSIGMGFLHTDDLTLFGWLYIIGEIGIIVALALYQIRTAQNIQT